MFWNLLKYNAIWVGMACWIAGCGWSAFYAGDPSQVMELWRLEVIVGSITSLVVSLVWGVVECCNFMDRNCK